MNDFDDWVVTVDALCRAHLACDWNDLCGDMEPLRSAFEAGDEPRVFVRWWAEKYDLQWRQAREMRG